MKNSAMQAFLRTVALLCAVVSLALCLVGCGEKTPDPTTEPTETTADTTPTTQPITQPTTPPPTTQPVETTAPTEPSGPPCDHVLSDWKVEQPSSCTNEGKRYKECTICLAQVETEVIPQTRHIVEGWIYDGAPATCTSQGKMKQECSQCKELFYTIAVDKLDHDTLVIDGYAATSSTPGRTDRVYCTVCRKDVQKSLVIPAIGSVEYTYQVTTYNTCAITGVKNFSGKELILPEKIDNYTVTSIGENAFDKLSIETVYIPKGVTKIGNKAFAGCDKLINITFQGTTAQWSLVQKGTDWNSSTGSYTVYCSNQSVDKK